MYKVDNNTITLSYSFLNTFINCRKAAMYKYVKGYNPKFIKRSFTFGTLVHKLLEIWYTTRSIESVLEHLDSETKDRETNETDKYTYLYAKHMVLGYIHKYDAEDKDLEVICLEKEFEAPIIDFVTKKDIENVRMFGRIDGICKIGNENFLMEFKTAAKIDSSYINRLWMDYQIILYCYYAHKVLGITCAGILYNALLKTNMKKIEAESEELFELRCAGARSKNKSGKTNMKRKQGETDSAFEERLRVFYSDDEAYYRDKIYISKGMMKTTVEEVSNITKAFLSCLKNDNFYRNVDYCFRYGAPCDFHPICKSSENPSVIRDKYETKARIALEVIENIKEEML